MANSPKKKSRAVFLDRDGTINRDDISSSRNKPLRLLPSAGEAIKKLNELGYLVIVVTNQGGIARGLITEAILDKVHKTLVKKLARKGAVLDAIYYCPHHPRGTVKKYPKRCRCRKPSLGMILKAKKKFNIDLKKSFIVGDMTGDIATGKNAGMKTILVRTGYAGKDGRHVATPDFVTKDLASAVSLIRKHGK